MVTVADLLIFHETINQVHKQMSVKNMLYPVGAQGAHGPKACASLLNIVMESCVIVRSHDRSGHKQQTKMRGSMRAREEKLYLVIIVTNLTLSKLDDILYTRKQWFHILQRVIEIKNYASKEIIDHAEQFNKATQLVGNRLCSRKQKGM